MLVQICAGRSCCEKQSSYIEKRIHNDIVFYSWDNIQTEKTLCMGHCKKAANIKIAGEMFHFVNPVKASEILHKKIQDHKKQQKTK